MTTVNYVRDSLVIVPPASEIIATLKSAKVIRYSQKNQYNRLLEDFAILVASRPNRIRHVNRLVVDWTKLVELSFGVDNELPSELDGRPLFHHAVEAFLPKETANMAKRAYDALYSG